MMVITTTADAPRAVIYSVTTAGSEKVLHSFFERCDGESPSSSLIDVQGTLYGETLRGGYY